MVGFTVLSAVVYAEPRSRMKEGVWGVQRGEGVNIMRCRNHCDQLLQDAGWKRRPPMNGRYRPADSVYCSTCDTLLPKGTLTTKLRCACCGGRTKWTTQNCRQRRERLESQGVIERIE